MKILLTGGTGLIGRYLKRDLASYGHELFILTRQERENTDTTYYIKWSWRNPTDISYLIDKVDCVINLAGEGIADKRWTKTQKELLRKSRIETTRLIIKAINKSSNKPKKLISGSAVGIYGDRKDEAITEKSSIGSGFLADLCREWENEANKAETNVVIIRIGVILAKGGGALDKMALPFKFFIGGPIGSGKQYMPWVTLHDTIGIIKLAIENENITGVLNVTSPNSVTNKDFSKTLGKVLHRPSFMPVPALALKATLGEMADMLLTGQKVLPERALEFGYKFRYADLEEALRRIFKSRRGI